MKKKILLLTAAALMSSSMLVQAATFTASDSNAQLETPDSWYQDEFEGAILFLTNGNDRVSVKKYDKGDEIPAPMTAEEVESFEEIYQTYYTTADSIYLVTGLSQTKENIATVRKIVESIQLNDHSEAATTENSSEATTQEKSDTPTFEDIKDKIDYTNYLYTKDGSKVKVYVLKDGTTLNANGEKLEGFADGAMKSPDGTVYYDFDPTKQSSDDYVNGDDAEEDNGEEAEEDGNEEESEGESDEADTEDSGEFVEAE